MHSTKQEWLHSYNREMAEAPERPIYWFRQIIDQLICSPSECSVSNDEPEKITASGPKQPSGGSNRPVSSTRFLGEQEETLSYLQVMRQD